MLKLILKLCFYIKINSGFNSFKILFYIDIIGYMYAYDMIHIICNMVYIVMNGLHIIMTQYSVNKHLMLGFMIIFVVICKH